MKIIKTAVISAMVISALNLPCMGEVNYEELNFGVEIMCSELWKNNLSSAVLIAEETEEQDPMINNNYVKGTRYQKPIPDIDIEDTSADWFFENSMFVGDSLMDGFRLYCMRMGDGFFSDPIFLTKTRLGIYHLLQPVSESSMHPLYMGEKMLLEDAVVKSGVDKVFIILGTNDLVGYTPEETVSEYNDLLYRIHAKAPDVKIYVIGETYIFTSGQKPGFTNENMRIFNDSMYKLCANYDYLEFINIGDRLLDSNEGLKDEFCSDDYIHMTIEGYEVWAKVLRAYAKDFIAQENSAEGITEVTTGEMTSGVTEETTESSTSVTN
ncbi:MAG: GDSL-type esterase/lipase family protein [Clostridiales bacterium]|nr:GDSL-type esterase/lipase family protein [Clostridiales bacterium]